MGLTSEGVIAFTDIVGFTEITDAQGDDVALALLDRQDRLVRTALGNSGRVVKELGDGLLLWFDDADVALARCLDLQAQFDEEGDLPLWVRMGLHWGCPRRRGDDIIGRDVNLAARITALAGGGEVLCSEALAGRATADGNVLFEPLGPVFVRGISEPVGLMRVQRAPVRDPARADLR